MTRASNAISTWFRRLILPAAIVAAVTGCGDSRTKNLVEVAGTIRGPGGPPAGATVVFIPEPPHKAALAFGAVDANGGYRLLSANKYPGVLPGRYLVCISQPAAPPSDGSDPLLPQSRGAATGPYASPETTPLRYDVPPEGATFDIDLSPSEKVPATKSR
jgi:hypothetical protein